MSLEISINRIVYTKLNQTTAIVNDLIYKVPVDGLYRISTYGFIPVHDISLGQAMVSWTIPLPIPFYVNNDYINADIQVTSVPGQDAASTNSTVVYLKAGYSITVSASVTNGAPPTSFNTHVCVEPLQAV